MAKDQKIISDLNTIKSLPSEEASPEVKKSKKYILHYGKAMYNSWRYADGGYTRDNKRIILNRKYAEGMQSVNKYRQQMGFGEDGQTHVNLDWTPVPIIPKYVDLWVGEMLNEDLKIECNAIDPVSRGKKDQQRKQYMANMKIKEFSDQIAKETGIPIVPKGQFIPESNEELELHMQLMAKLATEIAMEEAIDFEMYQSDFNSIKKKLLRDFAVIKRAAVKFYFDENDRIRMRYADFANIIVPFSVQDDLSDIKYTGEVIKIPIHDLRRRAKGALSEEDLFGIARSYAGKKYGNRQWDYGESFHKYYNENFNSYSDFDDYLISVLDFNFISLNTEVYETKMHSNNKGFYFKPRKYNYELPEDADEKRSLTKKPLEFCYKGQWVVGTDYIYDYGLSEDILREKNHGKISPKAFLPWVFAYPEQYDMQNKSLVERMMPHADEIQKIHMKMQHLLAKLTPPGQAIDVSALSDVILGKGREAWTPLELQDVYLQTGVYYYNGEDEEGRPMNRKPIEELKNSIGTVLQELIGYYNFEIQQIRDVTGMNEIRDASAPDKDHGLGTSQLALQGSRNTSRPLNYAFRTLFESCGKRLALMIQYNIGKGRNLEVYEDVFGKHNLKTLELTKDIELVEMGIKVEAAPDEVDRQRFEQNLQQSLAQKDIRIEDAEMLRYIPNKKLANQYMKIKRKQYVQEEIATNKANIEVQMQEASQASQLKQQEERGTIAAKTQADIAINDSKVQADKDLEATKHRHKMEELTLSGKIKSGHIKMASEEDFKNTALSSTQRQPKVFTGTGAPTVTAAAPGA